REIVRIELQGNLDVLVGAIQLVQTLVRFGQENAVAGRLLLPDSLFASAAQFLITFRPDQKSDEHVPGLFASGIERHGTPRAFFSAGPVAHDEPLQNGEALERACGHSDVRLLAEIFEPGHGFAYVPLRFVGELVPKTSDLAE